MRKNERYWQLKDTFPDDKAVYVSDKLNTLNACRGIFEPLIRHKYTFAVIKYLWPNNPSGYAYVVIREERGDDHFIRPKFPSDIARVMALPFTDRSLIVEYYDKGRKVDLA